MGWISLGYSPKVLQSDLDLNSYLVNYFQWKSASAVRCFYSIMSACFESVIGRKKVFLSHLNWSDQGLDKNKTNEKRLAWYWVVRIERKENWDYNKNATKIYKKVKLYNLTIINKMFEDFQNRSLTDFFALLENDQLSLEHRTNV